MDIVNEKNSSVAEVILYDENDALVTPTSGTYRIDDVDSGTVITVPTVLPALASTVNIPITSTENRILTGNPYETRRVTIEFTYGVSTKYGKEDYTYLVKNLYSVT